MGDYDQSSADDSGFYYAWGDNRDADPANSDSPTNQGPNAYFQRIPSITGTSGSDTILIRRDPNDSGYVQGLVNGVERYRDIYGNTTVLVNGLEEDDTIIVDPAVTLPVIVNVTAGNDTLVGGDGTGQDISVDVRGGSLTLAHATAATKLSSLRVRSGASAAMAAGHDQVLFARSLAVDTGGSLDLSDQFMVIDYDGSSGTLVEDTRLMLQSGRLVSSAATSTVGLGYGDNAVLGLSALASQTVDSTSLLVKYTYLGDTNLDGQVDVVDLGVVATNWQMSGPWTSGDCDYSGFIDVIDLGIVATNWQMGVGNPLGPQQGGQSFASLIADLPGLSKEQVAALLARLGTGGGKRL